MIHPFSIYNHKKNNTFDFSEFFFADCFFFFIVNFQSFLSYIISESFLVVAVKSCQIQCSFWNECVKICHQSFHFPMFCVLVLAICVNCICNYILNHSNDRFVHVFTVKHFISFSINYFTLRIHNIVVFQYVLSDTEVVRFNFCLRSFDCFCDCSEFHWFVFWELARFGVFLDSFSTEQSH